MVYDTLYTINDISVRFDGEHSSVHSAQLTKDLELIIYGLRCCAKSQEEIIEILERVYDIAYEAGVSDGYIDGEHDGVMSGYQSGWDDGYEAGCESGINRSD